MKKAALKSEQIKKNHFEEPQNENSLEDKIIEEVFEWLTSKDYLTDSRETLVKNYKDFKKNKLMICET